MNERPYFVWITDYPDEGSVCVDATSPKVALMLAKGMLDDETGQMGLSYKTVTAQDVSELQEALEGGSPQGRFRTLPTI